MKVSIVIVTYKVPYHLILCLNSLKKALDGIDSEIIVIDNYPNDETKDFVNTLHPKVNYIVNKNNVGFSKANNQAIDIAKGEYIVILNPDTIISETAVNRVLEKHQSLLNAGILGVRFIDGTGHFLPESKINKLSLKAAAFKMLGYSKWFYNHSIKEEGEGQTDTLVGAFMCFKKEDYLKTEGLDEEYFMYGEDIDLCFQFHKAGLKNYYLGSEKIIHFKGESTIRDKVYFQRFFTSVKRFFKKHFYNSRLSIGIATVFFYVAKAIKKTRMKNKEIHEVSYNNIYLFNSNTLILSQLEQLYKTAIKEISIDQSSKYSFQKDLIIFDTASVDFQQAINFMIEHRDCKNLYRFTIPQLGVIIGSDSSTTQAKVTSFE